MFDACLYLLSVSYCLVHRFSLVQIDVSVPNCLLMETNFVEVLDEPCHKPIIQNARINVFVAKLPRKNITMYHRHKEDTVYVVISGSQCKAQLIGADAYLQDYVTGDCFAAQHSIKPIIHRVECLDESPSDAWFIGSEILTKKVLISHSILNNHCYIHIPEINIIGCRVYRLKLVCKETTDYHTLNFSGVFISLSNGHLDVHCTEVDRDFPVTSGAIKLGYVCWFDGPISLAIKNTGLDFFEAVILELS